MIELRHDRYLVTGGAGFIGSHICEQILKQGKEVVCVDNLVAGKLENINEFRNDNNFRFVDADVVDIHTTNQEIFNGIDIVFHNAASKCTVCRDDPHKDLMVNAWGSYSVFLASMIARVKKVIHASTGSTRNGKPKSYYGVSKLAGEAYLRAFAEYHPEFIYSILQYYHVYGPRQESSDVGGVIPIFIRRINNNKPTIIEGDGEQLRHFTSVLDVVNANFLLANKESTNCQKYTCRSDVTISIKDLALKLHELMGKESLLIYTAPRPGDIKIFDADNSKLKAAGLEFSADFTEGLIETINWYRENL